MSDGLARRTPYGLIISLCLNFFLIGLIVAALAFVRARGLNQMAGGGPGIGGGAGGIMSPMAVLDALPADGQKTFCEIMAKHAAAARQLTRQGVEARRKMFQALRQTPADIAGFKTGAAAAAASQRGMLDLREKIVTESADALGPQAMSALGSAIFSRAAERRRGGAGPRLPAPGGEAIGVARRCQAVGVTMW